MKKKKKEWANETAMFLLLNIRLLETKISSRQDIPQRKLWEVRIIDYHQHNGADQWKTVATSILKLRLALPVVITQNGLHPSTPQLRRVITPSYSSGCHSISFQLICISHRKKRNPCLNEMELPPRLYRTEQSHTITPSYVSVLQTQSVAL